jgi:hypothetical protein
MSYHLFDDPKVGLIIALVVQVLMALSWLLARDKIQWYVLLAGPVIVGLVLLLDWLVVTNREELVETTKIIVQAAQDEDAQRIINVLSDDMVMSNGLDKEEVSFVIDRYLSGPFIQTNFIVDIHVRNDDDQGSVVVLALRTIFDPKSRHGLTSYLRTRWQFDFSRKQGQGPFQVINMEMTEIGGQKSQQDVFKYH